MQEKPLYLKTLKVQDCCSFICEYNSCPKEWGKWEEGMQVKSINNKLKKYVNEPLIGT